MPAQVGVRMFPATTGPNKYLSCLQVHARNLAQIHRVDLLGREKLAGVIEINLLANEYVEQVGVDMPAQFELSEYGQRFGQGLAELVWAVFGGERLENIGDAHHARLDRK